MGCEVLTSKTLASWDFLIPWNQTMFGSVRVTTGIKEDALAAMDGCQQEHKTSVHMAALVKIMKENFKGKMHINVIMDKETVTGACPPIHSRDILRELGTKSILDSGFIYSTLFSSI